MSKEKVIIANMSGFYGDRFSAAKEMVEGGPIDFLTGDYLAELTMAILFKAKAAKPDRGYAVTFLKQMEQVMGTCMDKGIKVVSNAGGMNPAGLAKALRQVADTLQINPKIAYIEGDNLMPRLQDLQKEGADFKHLEQDITLRDTQMFPVSANAYLGSWGIVEALKQEADIVVTGRVADAAVVMGPAAYYFNWEKDNWDAMAGAATAGHIIECSGQATGGNYSNFEEVPSYHKVGFPIAEMYADGSSVITKHPNTGGIVNIGTVTAQLMYEVNAPAYITPDVVVHLDTVQLEQEAADRVKVSGVKGSPATNSAKVTVNCMGGFQNSMTFYIAGLDIEKKVEILKEQFLQSIGGEKAFQELDFQYFKTYKDNPRINEEAFGTFKISVIDSDKKKAGKLFTSKLVELALCAVPGFCLGGAPEDAKPRIVHFPALIDKKFLRQEIDIEGQKITLEEITYDGEGVIFEKNFPELNYSFEKEAKKEAYLGELFAARSGDKGGNANLGVWAKTAEGFAFLKDFLTVEKLKEIMPDAASYKIKRYEFPNLYSLNFYIIGFLGDGVAASSKMDPQAKSLGEYLRAKKIEVPESLLN